jgi:hypothetical protein
MCDRLSTLEQDLRHAAGQGQFQEVRRLADLYCEAAGGRLRSLPPDCPDAPRIAREAADLLQWTLLMLYSARESCKAELHRVRSLQCYGAGPRPASLQLDA